MKLGLCVCYLNLIYIAPNWWCALIRIHTYKYNITVCLTYLSVNTLVSCSLYMLAMHRIHVLGTDRACCWYQTLGLTASYSDNVASMPPLPLLG